jgi:hypothetical protein
MSGPRYHKLTMQRASNGQVSVTVDILGPIGNPLDGLPLADKLLLLIRPYGRTERALMSAVKGLPVLARRAVAADILTARREQMVARRQQRTERHAVDAWMDKTLSQPGSKVSLKVPVGAVALPAHVIDMEPEDREPEMR